MIEPIVGGAAAISSIASSRVSRRWMSRRKRCSLSEKIHSATRRRFAGSRRSPKCRRRHHSSRMKLVSRGIPSSGCMSSITCSSVVPERGQPPMNSGRSGTSARSERSRPSHPAVRGRQVGATLGGSGGSAIDMRWARIPRRARRATADRAKDGATRKLMTALVAALPAGVRPGRAAPRAVGCSATAAAARRARSCTPPAPASRSSARRPGRRRPGRSSAPRAGAAATAARVSTPAEERVARAVARGLSNRAAAAELFLSTKTIEYHLRQAFAKLGVANRTQLALALREREPAESSS